MSMAPLAPPGLVYVLTEGFDYEGECPRSVHSTLAGARVEAERIATEQGWPTPFEWQQCPVSNPPTLVMQFGASAFYVREEKVKE